MIEADRRVTCPQLPDHRGLDCSAGPMTTVLPLVSPSPPILSILTATLLVGFPLPVVARRVSPRRIFLYAGSYCVTEVAAGR